MKQILFLSNRKNFVGTKKRVRISHGKRTFSVRLYYYMEVSLTPSVSALIPYVAALRISSAKMSILFDRLFASNTEFKVRIISSGV